MIEQMTYIANDGTVFYDEEKCLLHEWKNRIDDMGADNLLILNQCCEPCFFTPCDAYYVWAKTEEALDLLKEIFNYYDEGFPWWHKVWADEGSVSDLWIRDENGTTWYSHLYLEAMRKRLTDIGDTINQIMEAI